MHDMCILLRHSEGKVADSEACIRLGLYPRQYRNIPQTVCGYIYITVYVGYESLLAAHGIPASLSCRNAVANQGIDSIALLYATREVSTLTGVRDIRIVYCC